MTPVDIQIEFDPTSPYYKQIIERVTQMIDEGSLSTGDILPSMNVLSQQLDISSETVKKAYSILRDKGLLEAAHGIGFYVTDKKKDKTRILLMFDNINTYKQVLYNSFVAHADDRCEITIRLHNQDIDLFEQFIEENLNKYDYYLVTAHFPLEAGIQKRMIKALKKIPNRKLILADKEIKGLPGHFGAVYQDFETDAYHGLTQGLDLFKKYHKLNLLTMKGSLYAAFIQKGVKKFCTENGITLEIHQAITPKIIRKKEAFLVLNSQLDVELIELIRIAKTKGYTLGKDIGLLSYNESPINEIISDGLSVISTDFQEMGKLAADMITTRTMKQVQCPFNFIRRNSF